MHFSLSIILSVLLSYCTVFSAAASADCFRPVGASYTTSSNTTLRVSAGVACSRTENRSCMVQSSGLVNAKSTLNITTTHTAEVFDAIGKAVNTPFNESMYGDVSGFSFTIGPGKNGYASYNYALFCYDGVINNECFDDISADVPVMACQPRSGGNVAAGFPRLEGLWAFVSTDEKTALNMTNNPAANVKPDADSDVDNDTGRDSHSGAVKLFGQRGWWSSMMMMTIVMTVTRIGS